MTGSRRRSLRLKEYDYSTAGAYFVTICTRQRTCVFGEVEDDAMRLNRTGRIVERCWSAIPRHSTSADLDAYVIMPNHLHGILWFAGAGYIRPLPVVIGTFKAAVSRTVGYSVWQRSYHERVIRDECELAVKRQYIADNPMKWAVDRENPLNHRRRRFRP
ncbi:MAG: transposase [Actinomycetota bacterium]|nr:transposase [Actinomycetota bacterium]